MDHFGEHLMIDGYGGDPTKLDNRELVEQCLRELPPLIDMHPLIEPVVVRGPGLGEKDPGGWTGFVIFAESHISIHTFTLRGFVTIDVYTCKNNLDVEKIKKYFTDAFGLKDLEVNFVHRGTHYPDKNIY